MLPEVFSSTFTITDFPSADFLAVIQESEQSTLQLTFDSTVYVALKAAPLIDADEAPGVIYGTAAN